ncbi:hypothetical protein ACFC18_50240 [Streptomyces sp. NPDC056121]|uniref:hypothetical protein n=1 Tax=Streptomyces sp. NPDC056121 TaxID=3345718 RepID=UPI0035E032E7
MTRLTSTTSDCDESDDALSDLTDSLPENEEDPAREDHDAATSLFETLWAYLE